MESRDNARRLNRRAEWHSRANPLSAARYQLQLRHQVCHPRRQSWTACGGRRPFLAPDEARRRECGGYPKARWVHIEQGIKYLRGIPGKPQRGHGPGSCGQVSYSWSLVTWWCNDVSVLTKSAFLLSWCDGYWQESKNTSTKVLPRFNNIADGVQLIRNTCLHGGQTFSGQDSHNDKWSTVVRQHKYYIGESMCAGGFSMDVSRILVVSKIYHVPLCTRELL